MNFQGKFKYGQHYYDFQEGGMFFVSPNQITGEHGPLSDQSGYTLLFHPDLLLGYELAKKIKEYGFFSYNGFTRKKTEKYRHPKEYRWLS